MLVTFVYLQTIATVLPDAPSTIIRLSFCHIFMASDSFDNIFLKAILGETFGEEQ